MSESVRLDAGFIVTGSNKALKHVSMQCLQAKAHAKHSCGESDSSRLHPLLAGIQDAADFAGAGHDTAAEVTEIVNLVLGLLHPDATQRMQTRHVTLAGWPHLAAAWEKLPSCPVKLLFAQSAS